MDPKELIERAVALLEVGKKISAARRQKLMQMMQMLQDMMAEDDPPEDEPAEKKAAREARVAEARALLEEALSYSEQESLVRDAIKTKVGVDRAYVYLVATYPDSVTYSVELDVEPYTRKTYQCSYSIVDGKVTLGEPVEVRQVVSWVPVAESDSEDSAPNLEERQFTQEQRDALAKSGMAMPDGSYPIETKGDLQNAIQSYGRSPDAKTKAHITKRAKAMGMTDMLPADWSGSTAKESARESADVELLGDVIPLVEAKAVKDGTAKVRVIAPGWGSSGYYSPAVLESAAPVFKDVPIFWDHPKASDEKDRPERSLRDLAGKIVGAPTYDPAGPAGPGLYADAEIFKPYQEAVNELAPHIGMSIRAVGKATQGEVDGRKGPIIEAITAARSVDAVTSAGAGGQILQLFEAARTRAAETQATEPEQSGGKESEVTEAEAQALRDEIASVKAENARLKEALCKRDLGDLIAESLGASSLPEPAKARLTESLPGLAVVFSEGDQAGDLDSEATKTKVSEAIAAEVAYVASLTPKVEPKQSPVKGLGVAPQAAAPEKSASLKESWVRIYREQGRSQEEAEKFAALAAG